MKSGNLLESEALQQLSTFIEEATRSSEEGVKRFVEPAHGTLRRTTTKRHHIVFGRRGSGKSSLLRKAASDLTIDRRPIAYVDLESFKGHSYPDVLLSVLITSFSRFHDWLSTAAINPATKTSFWQKLFGSRPKRPAYNRKDTERLAEKLKFYVIELEKQLHSADKVRTQRLTKASSEDTKGQEEQMELDLKVAGLGHAEMVTARESSAEEVQTKYIHSKVEFLHRHIMEYQKIFRDIADLTAGDSFLFLDDLYHIKRSDQAKVIDYFHRIAKGNLLWLKIGTIRHRTQWYTHGDPPIGLKLGDDADEIDLDLSLEKYKLTKSFLIKILKNFMMDVGITEISDILTKGVLDRLVLASGGVARDFLGIFRRSIDVARERSADKLNAEDVNVAAGEYDTSKREELKRDTLDDSSGLETEFQEIRTFCLEKAGANVFLLTKDLSGPSVQAIQELVDLRLLHRIRSRVTVSGRVGKIFEAYMLDISQYTGSRKRRELDMVEFWRSDKVESLRKVSLIYK